MNIIFFGTPKEVVPVLESLIKHYTVVAVVTAPDQKSGRKQILTPSPIKVVAQQHNIPVIQPENLSQAHSQLSAFSPQILVVAAYGKIIPNDILAIPQHGAINIHPSLLPKYRGATPIQTALLNGDITSGVTFIKMDEKMDHGPILHQIPFTLEKTDTFEWLMQTMFAQAAMVLPHVIDEYISGKQKPQAQDASRATFTKIITKEDGYVDIEKIIDQKSKTKLDRMIRAYYPWPGVWTRIPNIIARNPEHIKGDKAISMNQLEGKMLKFLPKQQIQVEGKKPISVKDFLNGYPEMREKIEKLF